MLGDAMMPQQDCAGIRDEWDDYWGNQRDDNKVYVGIAHFYRNRIVGTTLTHWVRTTFPKGASLLRTGYGSGGVFSLGVMEHFTVEGIATSLRETHRIPKPKSQTILIWSREWGPSAGVPTAVRTVLQIATTKRRTTCFIPVGSIAMVQRTDAGNG